MCIMEVRPGQHHSTIAQAQAHNVGTVCGDLEMFETLLMAHPHEDTEHLVGEVQQLCTEATALYERCLDLWSEFLAREVDKGTGECIPRDGADIRAIIAEMVEYDKRNARTYETRTETFVPSHSHD